MNDLLDQKNIQDEFGFDTFKNCECIKHKDEQISEDLIETILHNFTSEQVGFYIAMTNGGRIHYIAMKISIHPDYSLWSITPCHKNEVAREVTPIFLLGKSLENGKSWLAMESRMGKLWSFGSVNPVEIKDMMENIL